MPHRTPVHQKGLSRDPRNDLGQQFSKCGLRDLLELGVRDPRGLARYPWGQNYFPNHPKTLSGFFPLILLQVCSGIFQRLHDTQCCKRLNAEVYLWLQLSSIKPSIKETGRNVKQWYSSHNLFLFWKTWLFFKKYIVYINMEWFYYCYFLFGFF